MLKELGANCLGGGKYGFLLWAPFREKVELRVVSPVPQNVLMKKVEKGYFEAIIEGLEQESRYLYVLDGSLDRPDPASRFQPGGVHGPSGLLRHDSFAWEDSSWINIPLEDYIIYELHVGTFTREGTFDAAAAMLPYLQELGVSAVELMPVAQFPGSRNWGYDGTYPFAVQESYGGPDALKRFVNACHRSGIAVALDVVYNHFGPEGNYLRDFGPYFTDRYRTPWGDAVNFDGPGSDEVRRFFIENALSWANAFHIDALRIDAVHGIFDMSARHFLDELRQEVSSRAERTVYLIAESDLNDARLIRPPEEGGYSLHAQWNDDFHHALHTLLTGESDGYYQDFGELEHIAKALREGFVYSGQFSRFRGRRHGSSTADLPPGHFVVFSQNHDQVGNRMQGDRLAASLPLEKLKLAAAMVVLSPSIPLLFMGEEYGEQAPFQYFVSHSDPGLIEAVREGRKREFSSFGWKGEVPDPEDAATFLRSRIDVGQRKDGTHRELFAFYRELIRLRKELPALRAVSREETDVRSFEREKAVAMLVSHGGDRLLSAANFNGQAVDMPAPGDCRWKRLLDSSLSGSAAEAKTSAGKTEGRLRLNPFSFSLFQGVA